MECLCYLNLPHIGLFKVNPPSMNIGTPITAPKQWEKPPKKLDFDVTIKFGQKVPSHHEIAYGMTLSSQPTSSWSRKSVSPVYEHWGPHHSHKTMRDTPKRMDFAVTIKLGREVPFVISTYLIFIYKRYITHLWTLGLPSRPQNNERNPQKNWISLSLSRHRKQGPAYQVGEELFVHDGI